jgi:hypothetical protein
VVNRIVTLVATIAGRLQELRHRNSARVGTRRVEKSRVEGPVRAWLVKDVLIPLRSVGATTICRRLLATRAFGVEDRYS